MNHYSLRNEVRFSAVKVSFYPLRCPRDPLYSDRIKLAGLRLFRTDRFCTKNARFSEFQPIHVEKEVIRPPDGMKISSAFQEKLTSFLKTKPHEVKYKGE